MSRMQMILKSTNLVVVLSASILLMLATGCATNTTSLIRREVSYNPLPKMQEYAEANGYDVEQDDPNNLKVRKNVTTWLRMIGEGGGSITSSEHTITQTACLPPKCGWKRGKYLNSTCCRQKLNLSRNFSTALGRQPEGIAPMLC